MVNGQAVEATINLSSDRRQITIDPTVDLTAGGNYQVVLNGVCDTAGNQMHNQTLNFAASSTGATDTAGPLPQSIVPANGSENVSVNSAIVVTFDEPVDPTIGPDEFRVTVSGVQGFVAGDFSFEGNTVTFTPAAPLPGNASVGVYLYYIRDVAGNNRCCYSYNFKTESVFDTTPPVVTSITPADGAMDIGVNIPVVLTFNESLNGNTVDGNTIKLYANGTVISPSVYRSPDNRTITLRGTWPAGENVSVVVSNDVKDLSNNATADWVSVFSTAAVNNDSTRPSVVRQYPGSGSTDVSNIDSITLYTSEPMDESTLAGAINVAENGVLVNGQTAIAANGQAITFTPDTAFADKALIHVYLDSNAKDQNGNALNHYQGNFRMADTASVGQRPDPIAYAPVNGAQNIVLNPQLQVAYNQQLNEAFVTAEYITLRSNSALIPSQLSLSEDKKLVTIKPDVALEVGTYYYVSLSSQIQDVDGETPNYNRSFGFTTGATAVEDTQRPMVLAMSPGNNANNIALNPRYRVRFDEPVNPLAATREQNVSYWLLSGNTEIHYVRHEPLTANTEYTETASGVYDTAGNLVVPRSETFTTGEHADVTRPDKVSFEPDANSQTVPINSSVVWQMGEAIDVMSMNVGNVYVSDTSLGNWPKVAGNLSLSADGLTITWTPDEPLKASTRYYAVLGDVADMSGNINSTDTYYFTTAAVADETAPKLLATSIPDGLTGIATNSRIRMRFDEAVSKQYLQGITLGSGGNIHQVNYVRSYGNTEITLIPVKLLPTNTEVTLTIAGVRDLANNQMAIQSLKFTTEQGIDAQGSYVQHYSPKSGVDVKTNAVMTVTYPERIDPTSVTTDSFRIYNQTQGLYVEGSFTFSADGKQVQFKPDQLIAGHTYRAYLSNMRDAAGNSLHASGWHYFTVVEGEDTAAPQVSVGNLTEGQTEVPVNVPVKLGFNEALGAHCVNTANFRVLSGGEAVAATVSLDSSRTKVTITPAELLAPSTAYQVAVDNACDVHGNALNGWTLTLPPVPIPKGILQPQASAASHLKTTVKIKPPTRIS